MDDDVIAGHPVDGCRHRPLVARLERVEDAEHLGRVAARRRRVRQDRPDLLLGVDNVYRSDGEGDALLVDVGGILVVNPVLGAKRC